MKCSPTDGLPATESAASRPTNTDAVAAVTNGLVRKACGESYEDMELLGSAIDGFTWSLTDLEGTCGHPRVLRSG